ncbi:flagellar biosynthetic protein FliR (plasmid) [Pseudomonas silesiensis]|uniref:flagellar biosynthetic protein FliR n=1 Tax=Pseudomonas silesiensis TaxID=1853130 RepID=UPI0030CB9955
MFDFTSVQMQAWVASFIWPFFRITAFLVASPLLGHSAIPNKVKLGVGLMLTVMIAPLLPPVPSVPPFSMEGFGLIVEQLLIGIAIGFCMRMVFTVAQAAGEFIGMQMGLGFATSYSADIGASSVIISKFLYQITLLMFLAFSGHLVVLELVLDTFRVLPIGGVPMNPGAWKLMALYAGTIFSTGLLLALPLIGALLLMNLAMGILNRSAPQLTVFSIGFPLTLTVGLVLMMVMMTSMGPFLEHQFYSGFEFIKVMLAALAEKRV